MKDEKETKAKLLASAKKEFLQKGYMKASLRNICQNAGVTTGALYFFFKDKEDLFAALVEEPLQQLYGVMNRHYSDEMLQIEKNRALKETGADDLEASYQIVHYMYQYYDEFQLLLKSQGSRFETCVDWFVEISEKHHRILADKLAEKANIPRIDDYMIHWMSHMIIDCFVHLLTHEKSEEAAMGHIEPIIKFIMGGWFEMFEK